MSLLRRELKATDEEISCALALVRAARIAEVVDLLAAGTWELSSGRNTFTRKDIADAIEAGKCPAVGPPDAPASGRDRW